MNDEDVKEPLIHFKQRDGVLGLCFSFWGKVVIGVVTGVSVAGLIAVVSLASTNIHKIDDVGHNIDRQGDQINEILKITAEIKTTVETNRVEANKDRAELRKQAQANAVAISRLEGSR